MGKMNLDDLRKLREQKRKEMAPRDTGSKNIKVIVGMGTSGIAAGAKDTLDAFLEELEEEGLENVSVQQTGSLGLDHAEPTVEIDMPDMPRVIYGRVDPNTARKIVRKHILGRILLNEHIYDKPAPDIVEEGGTKKGSE